ISRAVIDGPDSIWRGLRCPVASTFTCVPPTSITSTLGRRIPAARRGRVSLSGCAIRRSWPCAPRPIWGPSCSTRTLTHVSSQCQCPWLPDKVSPAQRDLNCSGGGGETFARPEEEGHAVPAPGVYVQAHGREGLHRRARGDAVLLPVATELPAHQILRPERADHAEDLHLLVSDRLVVGGGRRLHGEEAHHLQHVVLDHVADRARLFVEAAAPLDPEALRHRDLHTLVVVAVPDRLEERVREAEEEEVLHRLLPEVVVDAEDGALVEDPVQRRVQRPRRGEVAAEGLLEDYACLARAAR